MVALGGGALSVLIDELSAIQDGVRRQPIWADDVHYWIIGKESFNLLST